MQGPGSGGTGAGVYESAPVVRANPRPVIASQQFGEGPRRTVVFQVRLSSAAGRLGVQDPICVI